MSTQGKKYRLITRSDFDGVVCAVLLKELDLIDEIQFVHPKDMQDGKVAVTDRDITANLPYTEGVYLSFDHHLSETFRVQEAPENLVIDPDAASAARVVYNYYGGKFKFANISQEMLVAVDKSDSAQFTIDDILQPKDWELLSFIMDARTGLGRFKDFKISNYQLMMQLVDYCRHNTLDEILNLQDVKERVDLYHEYAEDFQEQIKRCAKVHENLVVLDLRYEDVIYPGNRFMIYALFPQCNISIHAMWGVNREKTVFAAGKSIFNRTSRTNIGRLMLMYEGGGHANAGTCQIDNEDSERVLQELIAQINEHG